MKYNEHYKTWFIDELDYFYRKTHTKPTNCIVCPKIFDKLIREDVEETIVFLGVKLERGLGLDNFYFYIKE